MGNRIAAAGIWILLGAVAMVPRIWAQGGPPMITDDPDTPGDGRWEINVAGTARHGAFGSQAELPLLDLNYGVGERVQLKYEVAWAFVNENGAIRSGAGNSLAGVKWRFRDAGAHTWRVSIYPQVEFHTPGSSASRRGLVESGTGVLLPIQLQRTFSSFSVNMEAGRELHSRGAGGWIGGVVFGHEWGETLEGMAELHAESFADESALVVNFGARIGITTGGTLLLSVGRDLHNTGEDRASVFGYIGWQFAR